MTQAAVVHPAIAALEAAGVIAVIRVPDARRLDGAIDALVAGGIGAIEITTTVPDPIGAITATAKRLPANVWLGAGTILDAVTAQRAARAGARFIVSPIFDPEILEAAHASGTAVVPGCFSPTEIWTAAERGADAVKVFPATALGPQYCKDLRAPMPHLRLVPTGGVTLENAGAWIRAGALALGVGSSLVDSQAVERQDWETIRARARQFVETVAEARRR